ncbi:MAG: PAS domain S-box protein [Proteobacteria bacterium]|nr:PAS domain S-box protein [Pseudomonadota bacterium]
MSAAFFFVGPAARAQGTAEPKKLSFVDASSNNFPPVNLLDNEGRLTGFGREIADAVIEAVGGTVEHFHSPIWTEVLEALASGRADFIHDTGFTEERTAFLEYSEPILSMDERIFVSSERKDINGFDDLRGRNVACVRQHITHLYLLNFPDINCVVVERPEEGLLAVLEGEADAFVYPKEIAIFLSHEMRLRDRFKMVGDPLRTLNWHMTARKGDTEMIALLNQGIAAIRGSGEYDRIFETWFGEPLFAGFSRREVELFVAAAILITLLMTGTVLGGVFGWRMRIGRNQLATAAIENRKIHTALEESERRYRAGVEATTDWIWETDAEGRFTFVSDRIFDALGIDPKVLIGKDREEIRDTIPELLSSPGYLAMREAMEARRTFRSCRYPYDRLNGTHGTIESNGSPVFGEDGVFRGYRGTATDVTKEIEADKSLHVEQERIGAIMKNVGEAIITADEMGQIESFNPAAERIFGYGPDEVIGKNLRTLMTGVDQENHDAYLETFLRTGQGKILGVGDREVTGLRKDGSEVSLELSVSDMQLGTRHLFIGTLRDITARKSTEDQLRQAQKMEAVGHLTGGVAHDFNNMLGVILGSLEMFLNKRDGEVEGAFMVERAIAAAEKAAGLTDRLLAFSRKQPLQPLPTDVNALLKDLSGLLDRTLEETIEVRFDFGEGVWPSLVDPHQLETVLVNLAVNARDAMRKGGQLSMETANVTIGEQEAAAKSGIRAGDYVLISVVDTGAGMAPDILEHVFEPFFTTKGVGEGTGLGLSMAYGFVKQSGGHIEIDSVPGEGTCVRLYLPRSRAAVTVSPPQADAPGKRGGGEKVLVVEDDPDVLDVLVESLLLLGYTTIVATDGDSALSALDNTPEVRLLFTDIVLPGGKSGLDIVRAARERRPDVKILCTSGYPNTDPEEIAALNVPFIAKPYKPKALAKKIRAVLDLELQD